MSPHTNFHAPRTSLSGRIQIGHKSGLFIYLFIYLFSVNIKPPRHRFGFSLAWGWQFGVSKCKSMLVSKNRDAVINSHLTVDKWMVEHVQNQTTGESDLIERYEGRINIEKTDKQKYLGFVLSSTGDNMATI